MNISDRNEVESGTWCLSPPRTSRRCTPSCQASAWSRDEDGFGDATGEPGDKLGGTNMFPSPYSVWPKNILQFAEYAGSNIMNPRVTLNTSVWIFSPSTPILTRDTVTRNPSCPLLHHDISLSGLQSHPLPSIVTCDIVMHNSEYSNWYQVFFPWDLDGMMESNT